jgi:hypothetical protein
VTLTVQKRQLPLTTELFQHIDGGIYRFLCEVRNADTGEQMAVYRHLWPFEYGAFTRPMKDFNLRFRPIERWEILQGGPIRKFRDLERGQARFIVTMNKRRRKAAEAHLTRKV